MLFQKLFLANNRNVALYFLHAQHCKAKSVFLKDNRVNYRTNKNSDKKKMPKTNDNNSEQEEVSLLEKCCDLTGESISTLGLR